VLPEIYLGCFDLESENNAIVSVGRFFITWGVFAEESSSLFFYT